MSEYATKFKEETLPGLELYEIIESMELGERLAYKQRLLDEVTDREKLIWLINEVNAAEGVDDGTEAL